MQKILMVTIVWEAVILLLETTFVVTVMLLNKKIAVAISTKSMNLLLSLNLNVSVKKSVNLNWLTKIFWMPLK